MILLSFVPVMTLLALNVITVFLGKRKFGISMPFTLMTASLIMYFSQLFFSTFRPALIIICFLAIAAIPVIVINRGKEEFIAGLISPGLWVCLVMSILILVMDHGRNLSIWDEFSHWGKMVKEMYRLDSFYSVNASHLIVHKDYPPFFPIFELLWCKLSRGYSVDNATRAIHFLGMSCTIPLIADMYKEWGKSIISRILNSFILISVTVLITTFFDGEFIFSSLYVDIVFSLVFVYAIGVIMDHELAESPMGYAAVMITQISLMLSKQTGIAFVLLVWLYYTLSVYKSGMIRDHNRSLILFGIRSIMLLTIPVLISRTWNMHLKSEGVPEGYGLSSIDPLALLNVFRGAGSDYQNRIFSKYILALNNTEISTGNIRLTYIPAILLGFLLLGLLYFLFKDRFTKADYINLNILFVCGAGGYTILYLASYLFCLAPGESEVMMSFKRYMSSYLIAVFLILFMLLNFLYSRSISDSPAPVTVIIVAIISLLLLDPSRLGHFLPQALWDDQYGSDRMIAERLESMTDPDSTIFMLGYDNGRTSYYVNYYMNESGIDGTSMVIDDIDRALEADEPETKLITAYMDMVVESLKTDDYLYANYGAEQYADLFGTYFPDETISDGALYRIMTDTESNLKLIPVKD